MPLVSLSDHGSLIAQLAPYLLVVGGLLVLSAVLWPTLRRSRAGIPSRREHEHTMRVLDVRPSVVVIAHPPVQPRRREPQPALR